LLAGSDEMIAYDCVVCIGLLIGCGGAERSPKPVAAAAFHSQSTVEQIDAGAATPQPADSCTLTKALAESCGACVKASCCAPPVKFAVNTAAALGCRMGCRKPLPHGILPPGLPVLDAADRAAVVDTCLARCGEYMPYSEEAIRLDACITEHCESQCLVAR
jgi:hypothetical protein